MEVLLMAVLLNAFCLHQGLQGAAISYNENGTYTNRSDELVKKQPRQFVQLTGGNDRCAGRVELFGTGGWGTVCDDGWNLKGGDVVCEQLGCGTALWVTEAGDIGPGSGPIYIRQLNCNGTERNLWQCETILDEGKNYCGHKEDAVVVCSGSSYRPAITMNTFMPDFTNWTTETVIEVAAEDNHDGISTPVLGCIGLSVTLFLLLALNAAQCAHRKRRNGGTETIRPSQASRRDNSDTSSESDFERYYNPDPPPTTVNNNEHTHALDSESTSSGECYEITETETENLLNPAVNQFYPEHCIQMTPLHNTSEPAKIDSDSFDSDSTCSGECYENTANAEACLQTLEGDPLLPEQPPLSHPKPQMAGNSSISHPYSTEQAVNQFYPEHCIQMTPLHNTSEPTKTDSADSFDSDSTYSGECYENTGVNTEACLQTLEGDPLLPEQPPLSHPKPQLAGNSSVSQPYSTEQDDSSTSSEEAYENVAELEGIYFARSEQSVHSSSDSDYDEVGNW
ncbi:T-cell differentiation antigen CD6 isoform X2 [Ictalurus punctatus]|uniref:T-cell differentiation antigen CD6 isoform X2 n=1 Tax=Ictalurus punctatus TaxID=7998 RepID=A0A2D0RRV1_ICTPU|nr:T-cell differentiation antigen CD6 isoform X2 [Ictalurus punctatus]